MEEKKTPIEKTIEKERYEILEQVEGWLEVPVIILGFFWLILLVIELLWGLTPFLNALVYFIWIIFLIDFFLRFFLAPKKVEFLKDNWLTALSLPIPALRLFQIFRFMQILRIARATRGLRLVKLVASVNRGMRGLTNTMARRGFGYAVALTFLIVVVGAAGMFAFERSYPGFESYGDSLWWTAMVMTTIGSQHDPQTAEGRLLTLFLSVYSFAVFSYITASLASFFIGQEAEAEDSNVVGVGTIETLREEIRALRSELREANGRTDSNVP